jgi:hypothetical protein
LSDEVCRATQQMSVFQQPAADLAAMAVKCNEKTIVMPDLIRHPVCVHGLGFRLMVFETVT